LLNRHISPIFDFDLVRGIRIAHTVKLSQIKLVTGRKYACLSESEATGNVSSWEAKTLT